MPQLDYGLRTFLDRWIAHQAGDGLQGGGAAALQNRGHCGGQDGDIARKNIVSVKFVMRNVQDDCVCHAGNAL